MSAVFSLFKSRPEGFAEVGRRVFSRLGPKECTKSLLSIDGEVIELFFCRGRVKGAKVLLCESTASDVRRAFKEATRPEGFSTKLETSEILVVVQDGQ